MTLPYEALRICMWSNFTSASVAARHGFPVVLAHQESAPPARPPTGTYQKRRKAKFMQTLKHSGMTTIGTKPLNFEEHAGGLFMRSLSYAGVLICLLTVLVSCSLSQENVADVVKRNSDAVVLIAIPNSSGQETALGSGFSFLLRAKLLPIITSSKSPTLQLLSFQMERSFQ